MKCSLGFKWSSLVSFDVLVEIITINTSTHISSAVIASVTFRASTMVVVKLVSNVTLSKQLYVGGMGANWGLTKDLEKLFPADNQNDKTTDAVVPKSAPWKHK